jgi:hypothetical protein
MAAPSSIPTAIIWDVRSDPEKSHELRRTFLCHGKSFLTHPETEVLNLGVIYLHLAEFS